MADTALIQINDLVKRYKVKGREIFALNGVSLEVKGGERVAVMGQSGSGKSTLLQLTGGLDKPTSGSVVVNGRDLQKLNDGQLSHFRNSSVGFIFQDFNLISYLNALDNVSLPLRMQGAAAKLAKQKSAELLQKLGLGDLGDRLPHQLSGGQKQRVAIARAMVAEPTIILADEPTANLDETNSNTVLDLIGSIEVGADKALVIVTHNHDVAQRFDRIIYLSDGKISTPQNITPDVI